MITASSLFLKALSDCGITHAFVNWGSDHPALLEDLERQRVESQSTEGEKQGTTKPKIITCPNEMVALSAAQGYAQVTGKPAAVIIHVDVGTQALAGAVHNVDRSRTPVLIYAGASPFSSGNEHKGTRNEWIMWHQDIHDQSAIVRQYMRFAGQFGSGATVPQTLRRALQIATSDPKGPAYLWARREVMEEEVNPSKLQAKLGMDRWPSIEPTALTDGAARRIASALLIAQRPLIITSYLGRNEHAVPALLALASLLAIPVVNSCPSSINVPFSSSSFAGVTWLSPGTHSAHLSTADVILVVDCDIPWIAANEKPCDSARVFVLDSGDPLRLNVGSWHVEAELVCKAGAENALTQIFEFVRTVDGEAAAVGESFLQGQTLQKRKQALAAEHEAMEVQLDADENDYADPIIEGLPSRVKISNLIGVVRKMIKNHIPSPGRRVLFLNESISNYPAVWNHLKVDSPGDMICSGGASLGWALGAAVGATMGGRVKGFADAKEFQLVVVIVGDGSYMFGVPSSAYWMARRYNTPFLTIVLNNGGWKSPKMSMLGVHPTGYGSKAESGASLTVGFGPDSPDYAQIAVAASAGWAWGRKLEGGGKAAIEEVIEEAIRVVIEEKRCAVVDCLLESI